MIRKKPDTESKKVESKNKRTKLNDSENGNQFESVHTSVLQPKLNSQAPETTGSIIVDDRDIEPKSSQERPSYVLNIRVAVDSDSDVSSDDSETEENYSFPDEEHYFNFKSDNPPFRVKASGRNPRKHRGFLALESIINDSYIEPTMGETDEQQVSKLLQLVNKLNNESFGYTVQESLQEAERLGLVFGLNRRESLDKKRNRKLLELMQQPLPDYVASIARLGFFWRPTYEEKKPDSPDYKKVEDYQRLQAWFKQLKQKKPSKARRFRHENEKDKINEMVPYRAIREQIKKSSATKRLVQQLREKQGAQKQYLGIFDGDVVSLRKQGDKGTLSHYDDMAKDHVAEQGVLPQVMSSGYIIKSKEERLLELAVKLDLVVRNATAKIIAYGIYYPEPN